MKKTKKEKFTQIKFDANYFNTYNDKEIQEFFSR